MEATFEQPAPQATQTRWLPLAALLLALVLASLASPVVKWLIREGGKRGLSRPHSISFCNVLFVGNMCAGLILGARFGPRRLVAGLSNLDRGTWGLVVLGVLLGSVVTPVLLYQALELSPVANVALLLRVDSVAYALISLLVFRTAISRGEWAGYALVVLGIAALILFDPGAPPGRGDALALATGVLYAVGNAVIRRLLERCSVESFLFVQNFIGSLVFFAIAMRVYGAHHFADAFSAELWAMMSVYALFIVVVGRVAWLHALSRLSPGTVASWSMLVPLMQIAFGFAILSEVPGPKHAVGAGIILVGLIAGRLHAAGQQRAPPPAETSLAAS